MESWICIGIVIAIIILMCSHFVPNLSRNLKGGTSTSTSDLPDEIYICASPMRSQSSPKQVRPKCLMEQNTNYYGNTYQTLKLESPSQCCDTCLKDKKCRSWSYDSTEQLCRLKHQMAANKAKCSKSISGYANPSRND